MSIGYNKFVDHDDLKGFEIYIFITHWKIMSKKTITQGLPKFIIFQNEGYQQYDLIKFY